jgi:hypothetical protein
LLLNEREEYVQVMVGAGVEAFQFVGEVLRVSEESADVRVDILHA